jgi:Zn-dependent protease with chaperone function
MDFFQEQDRSRTKTTQLIFLFVLAVLAVVAFNPSSFDWIQPRLGFWVVTVTLLIIFVGSMTKIIALAKGGSYIAENLGAKLVNASTTDAGERRLLNVVEEMSIASGIPVPLVYILDREKGINAFAAGYSPNDAVVAVTRNSIKLLNRDELQGVVAHEFSHILNGDMRLNIRLIGFLSGIMVIANIGYLILRSGSRSRKSGAQIVLLGVSLLVIGYMGQFFGRLIQSAVSRQREFLSDASAVQFTRNPQGIAGALKKIGGFLAGSRIQAPNAGEICHMFFGAAIQSLFATHPPLTDRVQRLDPGFDGQFKPIKISDAETPPLAPPIKKPQADLKRHPAAAFAMGVDTVIERPGNVAPEDMNQSKKLLNAIPDQVKIELSDILGAMSVICTLLLDKDPHVKARQIKSLKRAAPDGIIRHVLRLDPEIKELDPQLRLPILDLALPVLRQMSANQYAKFNKYTQLLVEADAKLSLFEFALQEIITHRLGSTFKRHKKEVVYKNIESLALDAVNILSKLAHVGHPTEVAAQAAFNCGWVKLHLKDPRWQMLPAGKVSFSALRVALKRFSLAAPGVKKTFLNACAHCVLHDENITVEEAELVRAVAFALDVPLPPFIAS